MDTTTHKPVRALVALGVLALMTFGAPSATGAAPPSKPPRLVVTGGDTWFMHDSGYPVVTGPAEVYLGRSDTPLAGRLGATIDPDDGTLPGPGACESAISFLTVRGENRIDLSMSSAGIVCGFDPQGPDSVITHVFTGPSSVWEATRHGLVNKEGFMEIRLGADGRGYAFGSAG